MRYCLTCRKIGDGVGACTLKGSCQVVDRGWSPPQRNDVIAEQPGIPGLIGDPEIISVNTGAEEMQPFVVSPLPGDAAPQNHPRVAQCTYCGGAFYGTCGKDVSFCKAKSERFDEAVKKQNETPSPRLALLPDSGTVSHSILAEAASIVEGVRNQQHGHKERSFVAIAAMWSAYLAARQEPAGPIRSHDVAQMMVLMKGCRAEWGTPIRDHYVDMAGYAGIAGELALKPEEK
jgi:hypothetical protein